MPVLQHATCEFYILKFYYYFLSCKYLLTTADWPSDSISFVVVISTMMNKRWMMRWPRDDEMMDDGREEDDPTW